MKKNALKRRRYARNSSIPSMKIDFPEQNGVELLPNLDLISSKGQLNFRLIFIYLSIYIGVGTLCFFLMGNQIKGKKTNGILDAIYFCVVTMTTVGYGDLVPDSVLAKLLACIFVFTGMGLVGFVLSKAADYIVEKEEIYTENRQRLHVKWALTRKLTSSDLKAADLDNDKVVSAAEFIVYKLKEMGTISEEDISVVMEGFKNLDVDQSGTLTAADLLLLESSQPQG